MMKRLIWFVCFFYSVVSVAQDNKADFIDWLSFHRAKIQFRLNQYDFEHYNKRTSYWSDEGHPNKINAANVNFDINYSVKDSGKDFRDIELTFKCVEGAVEHASLSVGLEFSNWSPENFVLMPGVVYDGNKPFSVWKSPDWYPFITDPRYIGASAEPFVTDIPMLNRDNGVSQIQMRSGHMTSPSIGFHSPSHKQGFWLFTAQDTKLGDNGINIEENRSRDKATISITLPVVREVYRYHHMNNSFPSSDSSASFKKGDEIKLSIRMLCFDSPDIQSLYDQYALNRKAYPANRELSTSYPFSNTFEILQKKYNRDNWDDSIGYYKFRPDFLCNWQIGWMGGAIFTYPLLADGNSQSRQRVLRMMDWLFEKGISPSGYFWDSSTDGIKFHGIYRGIPIADSVTLVRCNGDGLYYSIRHFQTMEKLGILVKPKWKEGAKGVARAFLETWRKDGQLGQYVSQYSGRVVVGRSASGAIVPAALVLASHYYNDKEMLNNAMEMGEYFYQNFTKKGITYGGPGDALQNPDCESSYGLVESFTLLYEASGDDKWLRYAEHAAKQFSTWVLSYNYKFPITSFFGRLGIKPMGAVFANPQNGTGTPAICTYSGLSLLNLARYTGKMFYAELLRDIAHNLPQYLSHPERMIIPDHEGWMSERVVTSDWLEDIGEISKMSTWCEASLALTYSELPGVYIALATKTILVFDNIEASLKESGSGNMSLEIANKTHQIARVKIFVESKESLKKPIYDLQSRTLIDLQPGEVKIIKLKVK